jgi:hypothetical protein
MCFLFRNNKLSVRVETFCHVRGKKKNQKEVVFTSEPHLVLIYAYETIVAKLTNTDQPKPRQSYLIMCVNKYSILM